MKALSVYPSRPEAGIALISALLLLVLVTIITLAGTRNTVLQERMTSNMHDRNMAFQAAEASLSAAIEEIKTNGNFNLKNQPASTPTDPVFWFNFMTAGANNNQKNVMNAAGFNLANNPVFVIEEMESRPPLIADESAPAPWFRITTLAEGGTSNSVVILHAGYRR